MWNQDAGRNHLERIVGSGKKSVREAREYRDGAKRAVMRPNWFGRKTSPVRQGSGSFVADVLRTAAEERVRNARRAQQRVVRRMLCIAASAVIWVANNY